MNIVVLGNAGSWYVADLERAAAERGDRCVRWDFTRLVAEVAGSWQNVLHERSGLNGVDAVVVRTMPPGSLEQVVFRMNLLSRVAARGICVVNSPRAIECAVDKYLTTALLQDAGLPVPRTIVCEAAEDAMAALELLGGDAVVKPLFGAEGRGIVRVSEPDMGLRVFRAIERIGGVIYLQQYVDHEGFDVRVMVLDGQVLGGIKRRSESDFRTNVARDARPEPHAVSTQEADLAIRAAAATGARLAGIDLLYDRRGGVFVIEVNAVPGWRAFQQVTGMDVAGAVLEAIRG